MLSRVAEIRKFYKTEILNLFCQRTRAKLDLVINTQSIRAKCTKTLAFSYLQRSFS